jgi:quercetin dioxygenase-like cupin family protein
MKYIEYLKEYPPQVVPKEWGSETWVFNNERLNICTKILEIKKDKGFHYHFHLIKEENFYVQKGKVKYFQIDPYTREVECCILNEGESVFLKKGVVHSLLALEDSIIIETSTYHRDSDSHRTHKNSEIN